MCIRFLKRKNEKVQTGIKQFANITDMNNSINNKEGDLAVVYKNEIQNMTSNIQTQFITFPETVTLPNIFTDNAHCMIRAVDENVMFDGNVMLEQFSFRFDGYTDSGRVRVMYNSEDGIIYRRTEFRGDNGDLTNPVDLGTIVKCSEAEQWNDNFGYFMQVGSSSFGGLYEYKDSQWNVAENQLSTIQANELLPDKIIYGKNGVVIGDGSIQTPDNTFVDIPAMLYYNIQKQYENMEPRVLTDDDKEISKDIYFIPTKYDGTPLIDTGKVTNMDSMFIYCRKLINIPEIDTSNVISMSNTFEMCTNLRNVSYINTSKVTNMYCMFNGCEKLVSIEQMNTSMVTNMKSMFSQCKNLKTIPELDTSSVINMQAMFSGCMSLTNVPQLNTGNVTNMGSLFATCFNLTEIPQLDTHSNTNMYCMFYNCNNVTSIPQLNTINVTDMNSAFQNCSSITEIPELNSSKVTIMQYLFSGCTNLITIPLLNTSKVIRMYNMVDKCTNLSDESLNNILAMCTNATAYIAQGTNMTLKYIGLTEEQATKCTTLSNYSAFTSAGWTTGY